MVVLDRSEIETKTAALNNTSSLSALARIQFADVQNPPASQHPLHLAFMFSVRIVRITHTCCAKTIHKCFFLLQHRTITERLQVSLRNSL